MEGTFNFLGLTVYPFGLFVTMGALVMLVIMGILGYKRRLPEGTVRIFGVLAVPLGIVFARLLYCLMNIPLFVGTYENPLLMLRFYDGGFSMAGLILGLVLAAILASRIAKAPVGDLFDVLGVGICAFLALVYLGQKYTELGVGIVVEESWLTENLPFLFSIQRMGIVEYRMAVYLYQAVFCTVLFVILLSMFLGSKKTRPAGNVGLLFFILYGAGEILLESLRDDGHMLIIFLRVSQLAALIMILVSMIILCRRYIRENGNKTWAVIAWILFVGCIIGGILLEFALDGRLVTGNLTKLHLYGLMLVVCVAVGFLPCSFLGRLNRSVSTAQV